MSEQHVDEFRSLTISSRVLVLLNVECLTKLFLCNNGLVPLFDMEELNGHSKILKKISARKCKKMQKCWGISLLLSSGERGVRTVDILIDVVGEKG